MRDRLLCLLSMRGYGGLRRLTYAVLRHYQDHFKIAVDHVHPSWTHQVYPRPVSKKLDYNPTTLVSGAGSILLSIDLPFADS